jgi:hypothetical protein
VTALLTLRHAASVLISGLVVALALSAPLSAQPLTPTGSLHVARTGHRATLLPDGRVLVAGGVPLDPSRNPDERAELYDPVKRTWSLAGDLEIAVSNGSSPGALDLPTETRDLIAKLIAPREGHSATRLKNGSVLLAGGSTARTPTTAVELYIPEIPYEETPLPVGGPLVTGGCVGLTYGAGSAVASNSKGHLFITTKPRQQTRLWEYDRLHAPLPEIARCVQETGSGLLGLVHAVRVDEGGNIWAVDSAANAITKFDAEGHPLAVRNSLAKIRSWRSSTSPVFQSLLSTRPLFRRGTGRPCFAVFMQPSSSSSA